MNSKSIKTHFDRNVFITFLVLFVGGISLLSFKMNDREDCTGVSFNVISNSFTTEDLIEFKSVDTNGVEWSWDFGDKSTAVDKSNVVHQFTSPGVYKVALEVNGQCSEVQEIVITERKIFRDPDLIPTINLPKNVRVGDKVVFSNTSSFAKKWTWSFGESTQIDGTKQEESYTYNSPGEKTILLVVNGDRLHEAKQRITVLPKEKVKVDRYVYKVDPIERVLKQKIDEAPPEDKDDTTGKPPEEKVERIEIAADEIQQMLVGYSNRSVDDNAIRTYFCYRSIPIFNEGGSRKTVSQLFNAIRDVKIELKNLKLVRDNKTGCIKSMTLDLRTKKGLFWKNF